MRQGDSDACIELLDGCWLETPNTEKASSCTSMRRWNKKTTARRSRAEEMLGNRPTTPLRLHLAGMACDGLGDDEHAADYFRRAADKEPDNALYATSCAAMESVEQAAFIAEACRARRVASTAETAAREQPAIESRTVFALGSGSRPEAGRACPLRRRTKRRGANCSSIGCKPADSCSSKRKKRASTTAVLGRRRMVDFEHPVLGSPAGNLPDRSSADASGQPADKASATGPFASSEQGRDA